MICKYNIKMCIRYKFDHGTVTCIVTLFYLIIDYEVTGTVVLPNYHLTGDIDKLRCVKRDSVSISFFVKRYSGKIINKLK